MRRVYVCVRTRMCVGLRVSALLLLISSCEVVTLLYQNAESAGLVAVADVQQNLTAYSGVAIVTGITVHAHHAVDAALWGNDRRWREKCAWRSKKENKRVWDDQKQNIKKKDSDASEKSDEIW